MGRHQSMLLLLPIVLLNLPLRMTLWAQDTTRTSADSLKIQKSTPTEVVLEEIKIEAMVEKPRVSILPKRIEPDFGKIEFVDRSFENELKQGSNNPLFLEEELKMVQKIEKLKSKVPEQK